MSVDEELVATIVYFRALFLSERSDKECFRIFPTEILVSALHLPSEDQHEILEAQRRCSRVSDIQQSRMGRPCILNKRDESSRGIRRNLELLEWMRTYSLIDL